MTTEEQFWAAVNWLKTVPDPRAKLLASQAALVGDMREALWICVEHNALHFGETHNTVVQGRAALASAAQPTGEPVAYLWQHSETGRTRVVMLDAVITADATWRVVGPLVLAAAPKAYAAPAPAAQGDALDAARYRRLRECNSGSLVVAQITGTGEEDWQVLTERDADEAIDAEINAARAAKEGNPQ